jgi:hypothetical protein
MKILLLSIMLFLFLSTKGQDLIILKNTNVITAKIIETGISEIKYKNFNNLDGPVYVMLKSDIFMIKYPNGDKDVFPTNQPNDKFFSDKKNSYLSVAAGIGSSYGLIGMKVQSRHGNIVGFGYHAGLGYVPGPRVFFAYWPSRRLHFTTGLKYYPYKGLYINPQFGFIQGGHEYYSRESSKFFAMLVGADIFFNKRIGMNIGSGFLIEWYSRSVFIFDLGLAVKFN